MRGSLSRSIDKYRSDASDADAKTRAMDYEDRLCEYMASKLLNAACPTLTFDGDKIVRGCPVYPSRTYGQTNKSAHYNRLLRSGKYISASHAAKLVGRHQQYINNMWCKDEIDGKLTLVGLAVELKSFNKFMEKLHNDNSHPFRLDCDGRNVGAKVGA